MFFCYLTLCLLYFKNFWAEYRFFYEFVPLYTRNYVSLRKLMSVSCKEISFFYIPVQIFRNTI